MQRNGDFLRAPIRISYFTLGRPSFKGTVASSLDTLEYFKLFYKNVRWHFIDLYAGKVVSIRDGWAIAIDTSGYDQFRGSRVLFTGAKDFNFEMLSGLIDKWTHSEQLSSHLASAWSDCIYREYSILNMSVMPILDPTCRPKSFMMPIFLYNLSRYYEGKSNQLFKTYAPSEKAMMRAYLDSAFEESTFNKNLSHLENYCSRVLFIEDPQMINALIDFGEQAQDRVNRGKEIIQSIDEFEKFIRLVLWYWAEKEVNIYTVAF